MILYKEGNIEQKIAADASPCKPRFTGREIEVMILLCKEHSTKQIAGQLRISPHTVESYKKSLKTKTGSFTQVGIVVYAVKNNLFLLVSFISFSDLPI